MSVYEQCKLFLSWGQKNPNYYRVFVGAGLTIDQYKEITGQDYPTQNSAQTAVSATDTILTSTDSASA